MNTFRRIILIVVAGLVASPVAAQSDADQCKAFYTAGDYKQAVARCTKAAGQGDGEAQLNLGRMYHNGQGVPQDYQQAFKLYSSAGSQGYADADSQTFVEEMYYHGEDRAGPIESNELPDYPGNSKLVPPEFPEEFKPATRAGRWITAREAREHYAIARKSAASVAEFQEFLIKCLEYDLAQRASPTSGRVAISPAVAGVSMVLSLHEIYALMELAELAPLESEFFNDQPGLVRLYEMLKQDGDPGAEIIASQLSFTKGLGFSSWLRYAVSNFSLNRLKGEVTKAGASPPGAPRLVPPEFPEEFIPPTRAGKRIQVKDVQWHYAIARKSAASVADFQEFLIKCLEYDLAQRASPTSGRVAISPAVAGVSMVLSLHEIYALMELAELAPLESEFFNDQPGLVRLYEMLKQDGDPGAEIIASQLSFTKGLGFSSWLRYAVSNFSLNRLKAQVSP